MIFVNADKCLGDICECSLQKPDHTHYIYRLFKISWLQNEEERFCVHFLSEDLLSFISNKQIQNQRLSPATRQQSAAKVGKGETAEQVSLLNHWTAGQGCSGQAGKLIISSW